MKNLEAVQKHFKFTISDEWANSHAYYIYEESTADGYSVYITTSDIGNIHVNENVNYYDSDLSDALVEFIRYNFEDSAKSKKPVTIYVDDMDSVFVEEAIDELEELMNDN